MKHLSCPKAFLFMLFALVLGVALPGTASAKTNYQGHPHYLQALSNLRAARWMIDHRPGNWQQGRDEQEAVRRIDAAINEIIHASIDDHKNLQDHPPVEERGDRGGRLQLAMDYLGRARQEISQEEDNRFANGLRDRAYGHIDGAMEAVKRAIGAGGGGQHPAYLNALSDLRAARWMIDHRPGNWAQGRDEQEAVRRIDAAMNEIIRASIDDHKNLQDHPPVDERPDRGGRLRSALEFLGKARQDISQEEDNGFAQGLRGRAYGHIDGAIEAVKRAIAQR